MTYKARCINNNDVSLVKGGIYLVRIFLASKFRGLRMIEVYNKGEWKTYTAGRFKRITQYKSICSKI